MPKYYRIFKVAKCPKGGKKIKCQKKNFFFKCFGKKMNDKRNLIFGNVMLLSQSRGEIFSVCFAKISVLREKKIKVLDEKKLISI